MGVVVELARAGSSLEKGADKDRVFSSKFASLPIYKKYRVNITHNASTPATTLVTLFSHDLGYAPVFQAEYGDANGQMKMAAPENILVDETRVMMEARNETGTDELYITIYARPIEEEFTSEINLPFERPGGSGRNNIVFQVARPGFDVSSRDKRKLVIDTNFKYLPVHESDNGNYAASAGLQTFPHDLGYAPLFWVYYKPSFGSNQHWRAILGAPNSSILSGAHRSTDEDLQIFVTSPGDYAYIMFKDPIAS